MQLAKLLSHAPNHMHHSSYTHISIVFKLKFSSQRPFQQQLTVGKTTNNFDCWRCEIFATMTSGYVKPSLVSRPAYFPSAECIASPKYVDRACACAYQHPGSSYWNAMAVINAPGHYDQLHSCEHAQSFPIPSLCNCTNGRGSDNNGAHRH